ncbi:hypothetical protein BDV98DRAFT_183144 [Pterulicium gracile]|uniref:Uncharacterized protein n=1 Tax=Pterulicium gracile TaxID=1884261 RepID=A0A5C3QAS0_9AGAR|nr:hypothetical protein BDV98DRAFT_183144 [Pterula gracilis]
MNFSQNNLNPVSETFVHGVSTAVFRQTRLWLVLVGALFLSLERSAEALRLAPTAGSALSLVAMWWDSLFQHKQSA